MALKKQLPLAHCYKELDFTDVLVGQGALGIRPLGFNRVVLIDYSACAIFLS